MGRLRNRSAPAKHVSCCYLWKYFRVWRATNDWCKGTFTLREDANPKQLIGVFSECDDPQYVGKTLLAIYRIEANTLTLAGSAPGSAEAPASFEADGCRKLVLRKQ